MDTTQARERIEAAIDQIRLGDIGAQRSDHRHLLLSRLRDAVQFLRPEIIGPTDRNIQELYERIEKLEGKSGAGKAAGVCERIEELCDRYDSLADRLCQLEHNQVDPNIDKVIDRLRTSFPIDGS